jgi:polyphosphate:AMP phosphotransferase
VFRTAELGRKVSKQEFQARERVLRQDLLEAENVLRQADFPVIVLFGGVDGAGKGDLVNALNVWMDPRWLVTRAFDDPSQEDEERPEYWRFWRELPPKGSVGLLLSAWYSRPLLRRAHGGSAAEFDEALDDIVAFEKQLADDGALIIKFWLHLGKKAQEKRFKSLEKDPLQNWRVTETDWENWRNYDRFIAAAERIIVRTSTGEAPWHIVEGADSRYSSLRVGDLLLEAIQRQLTDQAAARPTLTENGEASGCREKSPSGPAEDATREAQTRRSRPLTVLAALDTTQRLAKIEYRKLLATYQGQLNQLQRRARGEQVSTILVFEGWDAAGKGGAIRRINAALDSRALRVIPIAAPTDEERAHHYLWRFWRHLSRAGRVTIFDRSWYGRVLVERVEGFAAEAEWRRAYAEINHFEQQLVNHGIVLLKFWMHISREEQLRRFQEREQTPYKRWKLTDEDWRNRERWEDYEIAVHDMVERTDTERSPWVLVEANDKQFARVKVLKTICSALAARLGEPELSEENDRRRKQ